jgi:hypothetical protein
VTRESIIHTVLNELREECGCVLNNDHGSLEPLGWYFPSQGFTDEIVYLFTAKPVCVVSRPNRMEASTSATCGLSARENCVG